MSDLTHYTPDARAAMESLLRSPEWRASIETLVPARARLRQAGSAPSQLGGAAGFLRERNGPTAQRLLEQGERDASALRDVLADWRPVLAGGERFPLLFLGLVLTLDCSFSPRCLYCNQARLPERMGLDDWKAVVTEAADPVPPYVYITGGEPLLWAERLWGETGLIAHAAGLGCAVNVNTNAALITPDAAIGLVASGTARLHISLDSADPHVAGVLFGAPERVEAVWRGIRNVLLARALLGAPHPVVHFNCVLTRLNLFAFPDLLRAMLHAAPADGPAGDFAFHLIPVGGASNAGLRPSKEEWRRFYTETWSQAEEVWRRHQERTGVPDADRKPLDAHVPFANPWLRVDHRADLETYCAQAAEGSYWRGALSERCYLAPSQAYVLPDGSQHWCGGHAIQRPEPLGSVLGSTLRDNIRRSAHRLAELPAGACAGCAGATCVINQSMERDLGSHVDALLAAAAPGTVRG